MQSNRIFFVLTVLLYRTQFFYTDHLRTMFNLPKFVFIFSYYLEIVKPITNKNVVFDNILKTFLENA